MPLCAQRSSFESLFLSCVCPCSRIAATGSTLFLIRFIKDLWNAAASSEEELEFQEEVMGDSLNALMNLTTNLENQVRAGMTRSFVAHCGHVVRHHFADDGVFHLSRTSACFNE